MRRIILIPMHLWCTDIVFVCVCMCCNRWSDLQYPDYHTSCKSECNRSCTYHFWYSFGNFFGGSISKLAGGVGQISVKVTGSAYTAKIPGLSKIPVIGGILFNYGFLTYLCIIIAVLLSFFLFKTRAGLNLRAIGENPGTADAAGINVIKYKYLSTCIGAGLAGLGGLYFVMEYSGGTWTDNGFGDRGWLAVALVIFALWKPLNAIWGAFLFGALYILYLYIPGLDEACRKYLKHCLMW